MEAGLLPIHRRNDPLGGQPLILEPRSIKIHDRSLENQDQDNADGLWASRVTVTEPSIVKGDQGKRLPTASGYVGLSA